MFRKLLSKFESDINRESLKKAYGEACKKTENGKTTDKIIKQEVFKYCSLSGNVPA